SRLWANGRRELSFCFPVFCFGLLFLFLFLLSVFYVLFLYSGVVFLCTGCSVVWGVQDCFAVHAEAHAGGGDRRVQDVRLGANGYCELSFLFSLGCVFYLPFSVEVDYTTRTASNLIARLSTVCICRRHRRPLFTAALTSPPPVASSPLSQVAHL
ncbi:unnamed protein product, partial [Phaeothamnion confervicola]